MVTNFRPNDPRAVVAAVCPVVIGDQQIEQRSVSLWTKRISKRGVLKIY